MPHVILGDMRMFYQDLGDPSAAPLVLLHGFTQTGSRAWEKLFSTFGATYRVLVPDLRGHGGTDNPQGGGAMNVVQFASDIADFCRALNIERAAFCGHSAGAMLQLTLALRTPGLTAACVLSAGSYYLPDAVREWLRSQTPESLAEGDDPAAVREFRAAHTALGPDNGPTVLRAWLDMGDHPHADDFPQVAEIRTIQAPILIIHGDRDEYFPAEDALQLYRFLPNAQLTVLPAIGHDIPMDRPEWVGTMALDFLSRQYQ
jgi:pimeloyl-ACP methyl ester carboxylesterase